MSLDLSRLEKVVALADGAVRARCPACAESGQDHQGEHLKIYPNGKFGCCVHPGNREHRQRIFSLAGKRSPRRIQVKAPSAKPTTVLATGILGRLGRVFENQNTICHWDAWDGVNEIKNDRGEVGTLGTPKTKSADDSLSLFGTLGTPSSKPYACTKKESEREGENNVYTHKGFCPGVPSVPAAKQAEGSSQPANDFEQGVPSVPSAKGGEAPQPAVGGQRLPYLMADGTLVIPFSSPERYHWWKGGQSVATTRAELLALAKGPETTPTESRS